MDKIKRNHSVIIIYAYTVNGMSGSGRQSFKIRNKHVSSKVLVEMENIILADLQQKFPPTFRNLGMVQRNSIAITGIFWN
jgi:hypothetical protein